MLRNIRIAIVASSILAPIALVSTGVSAANYTPPRSVIPTFARTTIQQPRTQPRTNTYYNTYTGHRRWY